MLRKVRLLISLALTGRTWTYSITDKMKGKKSVNVSTVFTVRTFSTETRVRMSVEQTGSRLRLSAVNL
jgi:hypothetical protein